MNLSMLGVTHAAEDILALRRVITRKLAMTVANNPRMFDDEESRSTTARPPGAPRPPGR